MGSFTEQSASGLFMLDGWVGSWTKLPEVVMGLVRPVKRQHKGKDPRGCSGRSGFLLHQSFILSLPVSLVTGRFWFTEGPHAVVPQALPRHRHSPLLPPGLCLQVLVCTASQHLHMWRGTALSLRELEPFRIAPPNAISSHSLPHCPWIFKTPSSERGTRSCTREHTACMARAQGWQRWLFPSWSGLSFLPLWLPLALAVCLHPHLPRCPTAEGAPLLCAVCAARDFACGT